LGEYSLCLSEGYKGEWAGLKKWQHWQKYKIGKLEEGSPNQENAIEMLPAAAPINGSTPMIRVNASGIRFCMLITTTRYTLPK
jgi:hypothetical protein